MNLSSGRLMMDRVCYLHVGTGKTGSSAIQYALTAAADDLSQRGYLYPDVTGNFDAVRAHRPTAGNGSKVLAALGRDEAERALSIIEPYAARPEHLVLSCEGFSNYAFKPPLRELADGLRQLGYRTSALVFFRPQTERVVSSYLQQVKSCKVEGSLADYAASQLSRPTFERAWNYYRRAQRLAGLLDELTVKWYPAMKRAGPNGVIEAAFHWLGVPLSREWLPPQYETINPSPGREALVVLQKANDEGRGGKRFADALLMKAQAAGLLGSRITLDRKSYETFRAATLETNRSLLTRFCPDLSVRAELEEAPPPDDTSAVPIDEGVVRELEKIAASLGDLAGPRHVTPDRARFRRRRLRRIMRRDRRPPRRAPGSRRVSPAGGLPE
jgi:hypothetical protein